MRRIGREYQLDTVFCLVVEWSEIPDHEWISISVRGVGWVGTAGLRVSLGPAALGTAGHGEQLKGAQETIKFVPAFELEDATQQRLLRCLGF